jgi:cell division septation protein DedD
VAEGETQYNIPVSSKQLIVYFVFLVIALSAAFLAGVMVGRNVDASPEPTVRDIQDASLPEEPAPSPTPDALTYGSSLQSDKVEGLSPSAASAPAPAASPRASAPVPALPAPSSKAAPPVTAAARPTPEPARAPSPAAKAPEKATPKPAAKATPTPKPAAAPKAPPKATPTPKSQKSPAAPINRLTIQVGAFKERAAAEAIVKRLKGKGYSAYLVPVSEGLFNVRVGSFTDREDAERVLAKLETQEKFKPFIVKP